MKKIVCIFLLISSVVFCNWNQGDFVDEFGDSIGKKYIVSNTIEGDFSNTATKDSKLFVQLLISNENKVAIFMSEYSENRPAEKFEGYIKAKNEEGKIYSSKVDQWNNSGGLSVYDRKDLIKFLENSKEVKFYITNKYSSRYNFVLKTQGLKEALDLLNKK